MKVRNLFEDDFENELDASRHKSHGHEKIAGKEPNSKDIPGRIAYHEKLRTYHFNQSGAYHQNQYRRQNFIIRKLKEIKLKESKLFEVHFDKDGRPVKDVEQPKKFWSADGKEITKAEYDRNWADAEKRAAKHREEERRKQMIERSASDKHGWKIKNYFKDNKEKIGYLKKEKRYLNKKLSDIARNYGTGGKSSTTSNEEWNRQKNSINERLSKIKKEIENLQGR
jgi:hypothetical protein